MSWCLDRKYSGPTAPTGGERRGGHPLGRVWGTAARHRHGSGKLFLRSREGTGLPAALAEVRAGGHGSLELS